MAEIMARIETWASPLVAARLSQRYPGEIQVVDPDEDARAYEGPAILVVGCDEIRGPREEFWLTLMTRALPGRPVIHGGTHDRELLLEAINRWRVFRMVSRKLGTGALLDAICAASASCAIELGVARNALTLRSQCGQLEAALASLDDTREQVFHGARVSTAAAFAEEILPACRRYFEAWGSVEEALASYGREDLAALAAEESRDMASWQMILEEAGRLANAGPGDDQGSAVREAGSLDAVVDRAISLLRRDPYCGGARVERGHAAADRPEVEERWVLSVLLGLLRHLAQASGSPSITLHTTEHGGAPQVEILVEPGRGGSDGGWSLLPQPGPGWLGLETCRQVIRQHGGTLKCDQTRTGTMFRFTLPCGEALEYRKEP